MSSPNPLVLVVGATGYTGSVVVKYLLESGNYRVVILIRDKSLNKPAVKELTDAGAELRVGDISESEDTIVGHLQGVDILISLVLAMVDQKPLFRAAAKVGTLSRVVPSDFGPTAPRGIMEMHDKKLGVRDFVKELGLPHTFIEVGWWFINLLPFPHATPETLLSPKRYVGDKQKKLIISTLHTIGLFITKVLTDPRTLNQTVVIHDGEMTLGEAYALAEKTTGEDFSDYIRSFSRTWRALASLRKSTSNTRTVFICEGTTYYLRHWRGGRSMRAPCILRSQTRTRRKRRRSTTRTRRRWSTTSPG